MTFKVCDQFAEMVDVIFDIAEDNVAAMANPPAKFSASVTMIEVDWYFVVVATFAFFCFFSSGDLFLFFESPRPDILRSVSLFVLSPLFCIVFLFMFFVPTFVCGSMAFGKWIIRKASSLGSFTAIATARSSSSGTEDRKRHDMFVAAVAATFPTRTPPFARASLFGFKVVKTDCDKSTESLSCDVFVKSPARHLLLQSKGEE